MPQKTDTTQPEDRTISHPSEEHDSIGLRATAVSKSPKEVLALGERIVRQLELADHGTVLVRWMAHHLAEVLTEAKDSTGPEKADAKARAADLVLRIWSHRQALPDRATPLGAYRKAIDVLERMMPDANPWIRRQSTGYEALLNEMFEILGRATYAGLLLTSVSEPRRVTPEEVRALDEEERRLLALLEEWRSFAPWPNPKIQLTFVGPDHVEGPPDHDEASTPVATPQEEAADPSEAAERSDAELHSAITEDLERMQALLADLTARWRAKGPCQSDGQ